MLPKKKKRPRNGGGKEVVCFSEVGILFWQKLGSSFFGNANISFFLSLFPSLEFALHAFQYYKLCHSPFIYICNYVSLNQTHFFNLHIIVCQSSSYHRWVTWNNFYHSSLLMLKISCSLFSKKEKKKFRAHESMQRKLVLKFQIKAHKRRLLMWGIFK